MSNSGQKRQSKGSPEGGRFAKDTRGKENIPTPGVSTLSPPSGQENPTATADTLTVVHSKFTQARQKDSPENLAAIRSAMAASGLSRAVVKRLLMEETGKAGREIETNVGRPDSLEEIRRQYQEAQAIGREHLIAATERYTEEKEAKAKQQRQWDEGWSRQIGFVRGNEGNLDILEVTCADMRPGDLFGSRGPLGGGVVTAVRQGRTSSKRQIVYLRPDGKKRAADWNSSTRIRVHRPSEESVRQAALALHSR